MSQSYWAVIPANIRYHHDLTQTAKLLYAEISALAQSDGFCWATDAYLAETLGCSAATVTRSLRKLRELGFIRCEKTVNTKGTERHIFCGMFLLDSGAVKDDGTVDDTVKNDDTPTVKNDDTPPSTLFNRNNKRKNTRASDPVFEINAIFDDLCGGDQDLRELIDDFLVIRAEQHKPVTTKRMANILAGKLNRFSDGDHRLMTAMLEKAIDGRWQSVYELRPQERADLLHTRAEAADVKDWRPSDD